MSIVSRSATAQAQNKAVDDVHEELLAQVEKWGIQHHEDGTGPDVTLDYYFEGNETMVYLARFYTELTDDAFKLDVGTWRDILTEEFYEAMAEEDTDKLYTELKQVAAVAISWMRDIKTRDS